MTNNPNSNPIGMVVGQYRITSLLGGGGMATVYRAHQISMERDVAVKIIKPELANLKDFTVRFEREAKMLASLSHANILKIFDYGQQQDMWYLVMELLNGGSLADRIAQGPLPIALTLRLFDQIASALDYAHQRGIVHRDLKPQNVLLDDGSNALLTDFGLARLVNSKSSLTMSGVAVGTPSYMAPEQWSSGAVDLRADVYSLGVMLFEMLSGALPFDGDTPFRLMHMHIYENPRSVQDFKPNTSPDIEFIIAKALAKSPEDRFQSAGQMANALRKAVTGVTTSFVSERPGPASPVSTRNLSAPIDKVTLLPYDAQGDATVSPAGASGLDHITMLPIDDPQPQHQSVPSQSTPAASIPAPFADTGYPAKLPSASGKQRASSAKAARRAQQQRNMNMLTIATGALAVIVVGIFAILLVQRNSNQANVPTDATAGVSIALNSGSPTDTSTPVPTETPAATHTPRNTETVTYTPSATSTRRPTWTKMPTSTSRPAATRRSASQPTTAASSSGSSTAITGTIKTETELHAGPGEAHPTLMTVHVGEQFPIEGKATDRGEEWFEVTLLGGAPAWIIASAVKVEAGTFIPVVTPRPPPPPK